MQNTATEYYQYQEHKAFFDQIEEEFKRFGLQQTPNEFIVTHGSKVIHIAKRYEVLIGMDEAKKWVPLREFIERVIIEEGIQER